ncbi:MAG TPA: glycosyltransferase [Solirubrobacteraceae bacterium]|nr:glycosyltransferase [Solirubrobacteraceae bacterium]
MAETGGTPLRIVVLGMSINPICGARDHATLLAQELERGGASCTMHWLTRVERSVGGSRAEIRAWLDGLTGELHSSRPDVAIVHYSVFSYGHAGLPLFVRPMFRALRRADIPVIAVLHEFAYSWTSSGVRGKVWALTQRAAFVEVMRSCAAALVTTDQRAQWIRSRRWLPRRPVAVAPVFSNLPAPSLASRSGAAPASAAPAPRGAFGTEGPRDTVGLFGYSYDAAASPLVLDALRRLVDERGETRLVLLGAPGGESPSARRWREAADARGLADALSFSGTLSAQALSDALASCEVLLFVASAGPSSRKGTLAASLASGRPVVAVDGPSRWDELARSDAALIVAPTADALAAAVGGLLADEAEREALGTRSRAFSQERMSVARAAEAVGELMERAFTPDYGFD